MSYCANFSWYCLDVYIVKKEKKEEVKMLLTINEGPDLLVDGGVFGRVSLGVYGVDIGVVFEQ